MITPNELVVLRAALRYFAEELVPHGPAAMSPYFDRPIDQVISPREINTLQLFLRRCHLRYTTPQVIASLVKESPAGSNTAVVLLPPPLLDGSLPGSAG